MFIYSVYFLIKLYLLQGNALFGLAKYNYKGSSNTHA